MGLAPLWRLRAADDAAPPDVEIEANDQSPSLSRPSPLPHLSAAQPEPDSSPVAITSPAVTTSPVTAPGAEAGANAHSPLQAAGMGWEELEAAICGCRACGLCQRRSRAVPGVGDHAARWMFVGEGPGAEEDRRGEPFVGAAGKLLDNMLAALGLKRGEGVYIANAVKCRPPLNRTPEAAEIAACKPFLERQIALVQPRVLVALGRPAAQALLGREISIAAARGKRFEKDGIALIVTYHPAYLLRNPLDKSKAWEDLCFARRQLAD
ncbi:MAG: uracil-DNA glycosylase [Azoarcus sp.]|nr:uracil-DNA glycosylase [Azoarcus sp.]